MSADAATVVRLRVHQFARLRGVCVKTVWHWIDSGKVAAEKDEGGHRWYVVTKINTGKERTRTEVNGKEHLEEAETA